MKQFFSLFMSFAISSCGNDQSSQIIQESQSGKRIYTEFEKHQTAGYAHYVSLTNWKDKPIDYFSNIANHYKDTCSTDTPILSITFCESFPFKPDYDSYDYKSLIDHSIVSVNYKKGAILEKASEIVSIAFYKNGKPNYVAASSIDSLKR